MHKCGVPPVHPFKENIKHNSNTTPYKQNKLLHKYGFNRKTGFRVNLLVTMLIRLFTDFYSIATMTYFHSWNNNFLFEIENPMWPKSNEKSNWDYKKQKMQIAYCQKLIKNYEWNLFSELFVHTLQSTNKFKRRGQQNKKKTNARFFRYQKHVYLLYSNLCKIDKFLLNWKWQKFLFPNILISMAISYYTSVYNFTLHSWKLFHYVFVYAMHIRNKQIMRNTCFFHFVLPLEFYFEYYYFSLIWDCETENQMKKKKQI